MKNTLIVFIFVAWGCEIRNLEFSFDADNDTKLPNEETTFEFKSGSFIIRYSRENSLIIRHNNLLLEGFMDVHETTEVNSTFALRNVEIDYEMMYGSFKPRDKIKSPWIIPNKFSFNKISENEIRIDLLDSKGELGKISLTRKENTEGEYLEIKFMESKKYNRIYISFRCEDEAFIGFGAQSIDVNHYGSELYGWVQEQGIGKVMHDDYDDPLWYVMGRKHSSHIPIPQILSSRNFVATILDDIRPVMSLCKGNSQRLGFEFSIGASLLIFPSDNPKTALKLATSVTGRSRVPPDFAFFPWIDAIFGSENVRRIAQKLRDYDIPASVIWTEDYKGARFKGERYILSENWNIDRNLYPDFEELAKDLHRLGYKFLVYFNPFVFEDSDAFSELDSKGLLIKNSEGKTYLFDGHKGTKSSLIDLLNEDAVNWLKNKMNEVISMGADGWMGDFAEWLPTDSILFDSKNNKNVSGLLIHNKYPVLWQRVQREVIDSQNDNVDRLFFVRSGWFGTPELSDVVWAGDQRTSFDYDDGLPTIIPIGIGLGICGISNYGHDIAGYQSTTNPPSDKELFYRWTTIGAFSPIMRTHHGYIPKPNWSWESDEETITFFKKYAKIHSQLFPYLKSLSIIANTTGIPIMRSLALEFPEDKTVWDIKDAYMLGDYLLVSPVINRGELSKKVYLPSGRWATFNQSGNYIDGKRYITIETPIDSIPVFVKEGAIIPMIDETILTNVDIPNIYTNNDDKIKKRIILIFLGHDGRFTEYNNTTYVLKNFSDFNGKEELVFEINNKKISKCEKSLMECYRRNENGRYTIYSNSKIKLTISSKSEKLSEFEIISQEKFDTELRLFF
ncbi:MAG: hypothetical protein N2746_06075 [Deltaproteobacteria bacterium]|nr:hypothetical protein [Deltaproteobacteria bacterium]